MIVLLVLSFCDLCFVRIDRLIADPVSDFVGNCNCASNCEHGVVYEFISFLVFCREMNSKVANELECVKCKVTF